ncbi:MAG: methyltransferase domain-containing protein [Caldimicrobium sp.]|jgi:tRNA (adenine57-N1/adenine58-N1)-methyltransferase|nr:methyltransferase domain-containing protein [Caldimicrobium sp.]
MPLKEGDFILLFDGEKKYFLELKPKIFSTRFDSLDLAFLIGKDYGDKVLGKKGSSFFILKPTIYDFIKNVERQTQIIYPKDAGYILLKLDVGPGKKVLECGTGSGALTLAFAYAVGEEGRVITYEKEERFFQLAKRNLERFGLAHRVELKLKEVVDTFDETNIDALFLDVREPWLLLKPAWDALKPGHPLGVLVPTTNQVSQTLTHLLSLPFKDVEVLEILVRRYKPNPERLRPEDRMVAHTGYLIFAKKVLTP